MENQQRRLLFDAVGLSRSDREFFYYIGGSEPAVVFGTIMIDQYLIQNSRIGWHFILNRLSTKDQLYQSEIFRMIVIGFAFYAFRMTITLITYYSVVSYR